TASAARHLKTRGKGKEEKGNKGRLSGSIGPFPIPFPQFLFSPIPLLSVFGIHDASVKAAAVIAIVIVVDGQIKSSIRRSSKRQLATDEKWLNCLAVAGDDVTNQCANARGRHRIDRCSQYSRGALPSAFR